CDGLDNDCNVETPDGAHDPVMGQQCDGVDTDLCKEGSLVCAEGKPTCTDENDADPDICDGIDNDCNPATADGSGDPLLSVACDGDDADLCTEGINVCHKGELYCTDETDDLVDVCDGIDNDCNADTPDGAGHEGIGALCDGDDVDLCAEGNNTCVDGAIECTDGTDDNQDICDGEDNDCDPETPDGSADAEYLTACDRLPSDGGDLDLCKEGEWQCTAGDYVCVEDTNSALDVCDGLDNDCDPATEDGFHEDSLTMDCDGEDIDMCADGQWTCQAGVVTCTDDELTALDLCNGEDEDCNPGTKDGQHETLAGVECDGPDVDLCKEGYWLCVDQQMVCTDVSASNLDLCDGKNMGQDDTHFDEDCDPSTQDGFHEQWLHTDCDTDVNTEATNEVLGDIDLCEEGVWQCHQGKKVCDDTTDSNQDLCNGLDDDCDVTTLDGHHSPYIQNPVDFACDGHTTVENCPKDPAITWCADVVDDADHCREGVFICDGGKLQCADNTDSIPDICDGLDNDCNVATLDGSGELPTIGVAHNCEDAEILQVVNITGAGHSITKMGRFNSMSIFDYYKVTFTKSALPAAFRARIHLALEEDSQYRMEIMTNCSDTTHWTGCPTPESTAHWSANYTYNAGGVVGDKQDNQAPPTTLYVRVSKLALNANGDCQGYTLIFQQH
ncbi:MAG: Notch-like protein, partial [Myxococcota bacterium]